MALSDALGNAGAKYSIEFRGRTLHASFVVQRVKTHLTMSLQARAYRPILAMEKAGASPAAVDRATARYEARCEAGEFEFDGKKARELLDPALFADAENCPPPESSQAAALAFIAAVFDTDEGTALAMLQEKPQEVSLVMRLVNLASFGPPNGQGGPAASVATPSPSPTSSPA